MIVVKEEDIMTCEDAKDFDRYFNEKLKNFDESTILTPNINKEDGKLSEAKYEMKKDELSSFCKDNSISMNDLFLAGLSLALNKFNFTDKNLIYHGNDLPFTTEFEDRSISIKKFLNKIHNDYEENSNYKYCPTREILENHGLEPKFHYNYNESPNQPEDSKYSNALNITEDGGKITLSFFYKSQLYTEGYINIFLKSIETIINQIICSKTDTSISDIAIEQEKEDIVFDYVEFEYAHHLFEKQAETKPDDIALIAGDATLTYNELNEKANRVANSLIEKGVKPKNNILILLPRTSNLIISILGILKAGCAFIPIDTEYPQDRINYIYENSQADYIISNETTEKSLNINELLENENNQNPDVKISPDDLAYMIYTSGSTGNPKGVMISHENICNLLKVHPKNQYGKLLSITTISFDVALEDILVSLTSGLQLIFANDAEIRNISELIKLINKHKPEVFDLTPSRLSAYLEIEEFQKAIGCAKVVFLGGEQFSATAYTELIKHTDAIVYNSYGPTETTITSNNKIVTDVNDLTVGKPVENYVTDVRDIDGKLLPAGVMGELYIGGAGVGKGYWNMPEKTKESFLTIDDIPYYRSGDYAIETPNGEIDIKGRIDNQIKLRGLRIELEEIEYNIGQYPQIKQNVVIIKKINGTEHLCAYFTAAEEININELKEYLKERLTRYMVPTVFMQLDAMPLTPNGKTDLKQLPNPELNLSLTLPESETEEILLDIAQSFTESEEFGTTDDLYALGFTSLTLMKFNAVIYEKLNANLNITELINDPTIKSIAKQIDNYESDSIDLGSLIENAKDRIYYPLTSNQLGVYYECAQSKTEAHYNLPSIIRFDNLVDADKLKKSIIRTIETYPYLKTRIVTHDGELMQKRDDSIAIEDIPIIEINEITNEEIEKENVKTFDLTNSQLFRFKIYKTPSQTILFSDIHHIIADGESIDKLYDSIASSYEGKEVEKESIDGYINSLIEKENENSKHYELSQKYFHDQLSPEMESTILPPDLNGDSETGTLRSITAKADQKQIVEFCSKNKITPNALILASTILALNKYTFSDETLLTTIFNGRSNPNYFNTQAFLVKTLPIVSVNKDRKQNIADFLTQISNTWKDAIKHSDYPYTKIAEEFKLKPEFFYSYNNLDFETIKINGETYNIEYLQTVETDYKLIFEVHETEENMELFMQYNDQLYSHEYISTFLDSLMITMTQIMENDIEKLMIQDIELETRKNPPSFTPVELPFIHKRFERQVETKPDEIALIASDATLTYEELNEKANRIANALIEKGVTAKSHILVKLSRNSNLISSILGILKAGCAYIPIDPEYPAERIDYIYKNSQADYIITEKSARNSIDVNELLKNGNARNPDVEITPDDLAYMIYTSGSTGKPKGVMISHENICNQVQNPKSKYNSLLCITTISFDVSADDILASLSNGLKLILADDSQVKNIPELTKLIDEYKPEVIDTTPSRLASYLESTEFCNVISCLKCIFIGGEQFSSKVFENLRKYCDAIVYNGYGPTETTVTSNSKEITDINNLSVGPPLENYVAEVRDIDGKLLPKGVMGELYIGGPGVGKGYYGMSEKTAEVFLTIDDIPYYRSGDYAIELPNGDIDIKGRIDDQIKLRGLRIEIGEIESNISKYPHIKQVAIVIKEINNNDHLCAYFTSETEIDTDELKEFLKDKLTNYMIPTVFMQIDEMPQTPNGKTDLKKLPKPVLKLENVKPENETEELLVEIASNIINTNEFGTTDELHSIGFTSLTLMKLNSLIYEEMGKSLDITTLFDTPTIKNFANALLDDSKSNYDFDKLIESVKEMEYFPLTENQLGIYYECIQSPDEIKYTMPTVTEYDKGIDADKLKEAIINTIEAHPYLKTRIVSDDDGTLKQKRNDTIDEIEIVKVNSITNQEIMEKDVKPFALNDSQLFRFKIYDTEKGVELFSDFHHIITDGISQINLFEDIITLYSNNDLKEENVDGYAYSLIENALEDSEEYESSKRFFQNKLNQKVESTVLTPDLNGNPDEGKIKTVSDSIDSNVILEFCKENAVSTNALFMASTILNLNKYTFSDRTLITTIFNGRLNPNYDRTQGFLVKTLPIITISEDRQKTVKGFINDIDRTWKETINNSIYPYTKIAEEYKLKPEFFYVYQEFIEPDDEINELYESKELINEEYVSTEYKIDLTVTENEEIIKFDLSYNDQLYSQNYAETFLDSLKTIIGTFIENDIDELKICDVELESERQLPEFSPLENPFLHRRFEKQVEIKPDEIALVATDATLTYKELNEKANRIANSLIKKGVNPKSNILVMIPRNSNLIAAIIGILKAGCAFVPLDLEYPIERIKYIYENSQADYIITKDESSKNSLDINELVEGEDSSNPDVDISPDDLAYMIYTSGSTGKPKGVMISHENACNQVAENPKAGYGNLLSIATIAFDTSLEDILTGTTNGIKIIFANDEEIKNITELIRLINENRPEVMEFTPSRLLLYLEIEEFCKAIGCAKCIVMGGEQFSAKAFREVKQYTDAKVYNSYGPTEATIASNYKEITDPENITIGPALKNYVTEIRDLDGKLLPTGVMGELYIGGIGVGKGYYNMSEKTEEAFLTINNIPYYRSGDYAIELPNGDIDIKGRIDNQIKLRGLRIEIGEIESTINRFPDIKQTVVVIKQINKAEHLCAYFTAEKEIDTNLLKRYLQNKLTKYMVPSALMQLDEIPQTPNGKADLKQLPDPELDLKKVKPKTGTEKTIFRITSELINTDEFGITDDLYALGFSSLTLMKLNSLIYLETDVNIDITSLFTNPTVEKLAYKVDNNTESQMDIEEIIESEKDIKYFPLTSNQLGIYYECMQTKKIKYTMPVAVRCGSEIDADKLKDSIIETVEAHPYLKTRIINTGDGEIKQKRCDNAEIEDIEIMEVDSITNEEIMENDIKAIPLDNNQLFRFKIYKTPSETVLFSDFHHIITDGVSQNNFFNDVAKAYADEEIEEEKIDGYAYSLIEEKAALSETSEKFFKDKFSDGLESSVLTPNINGIPEKGNIKLIQDSVNSVFVRSFCKDHSISPNVLFLTATIISLDKFTFNDKTLITTIFNGRTSSDYINTQGMLVKTLPLIIDSEKRDMKIEDYIKLVDKSWKDALLHSNYPYTKLAEDYQLKPEFFYSFNENFEENIMKINGKSYNMIPLDGTESTDYKINFDIFDDGDDIGLCIEYNDQMYTRKYVKKFLNAVKYTLFQFFVHDLDKLRIKDIELNSDDEMPEFTPVELPYLHKHFEKQVQKNPDKIALISNGETLTYRELNQKANKIANALIKRGVEPKSNILIKLPRTSNLIASIWGILKAGCTLIPMDTEYPKERIDYIYKNSQAKYIISDESNDESLDIEELLKEENCENPNVEIDPDDLAYMIYTSGSTGKPKGVMISHENICNLIRYCPKKVYDKLLSTTTISFDVAMEDIFTSLTSGSQLIFANDTEIKNIHELVKLINEHKPEVMDLTPSRLSVYLEVEEYCKAISCIKCVFIAGEQFSASAYTELIKHTDAIVYNSYGPTETTITSNNKIVTDVNDLTVGKPVENYVTEVRDIDGKLLPQGVMGELYIGGPGVGKGYWNMPEKTEESFLTIDDIPYYRSGDYAIETPNGEIDIKGRIDDQIKLRGLRIEIGEIESNIGSYPHIKQNAVVIKKINNTEHLCTYFTADTEIDTNALKKYLSERLTKYMVPTAFMQLDEMPHTPNGKTDVKQLPEPELDVRYVAPETKLEQEICAIYSNILNIEPVGAEDNFFEIGGTSLIASKLIIELLKNDYDVTYENVFQNQTPRKLAKFLSGEQEIESNELDIIRNYNYDRINTLLEENTLENFINGKKEEIGNVLLTGVTGFLGIHVLYECLKSETGTIYCMLRKGGFDSCEDRLADLIRYYFDEDLTDLIGSRIILSEGDITNLDDFKKLKEYPIDTIINCAAIVKHYTADDYIFKVNVDGVINGLKFAESRNNTRFVQISTVSVLSSYSQNEELYPNVKFDERTLYYEQDLTNKYLSSKFLAERMVLEAATRGLSVKIIRVGNLMSRFSDGLFQRNYNTNAFLNNIKAIKNLKALTSSLSKEAVEISPINYVAKGIVKLSKTPEECRLFHCINDKTIFNRDIIDALNEYDYNIREVSNEEFRKIYNENMDENIQGMITSEITLEDIEETYDFEENYRIEQTTTILHLMDFHWPKPDKKYLKRLIDYLNRFKYFD